MTNIYPQKLWNTNYSNRAVELIGSKHPIVQLLHTFIPKNSGNAIEFGCCPGNFLGHLGLMGYTLHGIDLSPSIKNMETQYRSKNFSCGSFVQQDFFDFCSHTSMKYNVVTSFGFIEHFTNYEEVFFHHCRLVENNGYVFVTFPNFKGKLQFALHSLFDRSNLEMHNLESMSLEPYIKMLKALKFKVLFADYFGGFSFWRENSGELPDSQELRALYSAVEELLKKKAIIGDAPSWSCYGGIIGHKTL